MIIVTNLRTNIVSIIANDITDKPSPNKDMIKQGNSNLAVMKNGYQALIEENIAFVPHIVNIYQNVDATNIIPYKYCYTPEQGFYENPNYVEPDATNTYGIPDELFNQIKADYREQIAKEVSENGYNA